MSKLLILIMLFFCSCSTTYRPSIVDIRDEPYLIDWSPRQPERFAHLILEFKP